MENKPGEKIAEVRNFILRQGLSTDQMRLLCDWMNSYIPKDDVQDAAEAFANKTFPETQVAAKESFIAGYNYSVPAT